MSLVPPPRRRWRRQLRSGRGPSLWGALASGSALLSSVLGSVAPSDAASGISRDPLPTWGTNPAEDERAGRVLAMVEVGGVVYIAGEFTGLLPPETAPGALVPRGYLAAIDAATGQLTDWNPVADGPVRALALSEDGKLLYLGGDFDFVGGEQRRNLAAIDLASGTVTPLFQPGSLDNVRSIAISGERLYAGGDFESVTGPAGRQDEGTHDRPQLAAFEASTGTLVDWQPPSNRGGQFVGQTGEHDGGGANGVVYSIAVSPDGDQVFASGTFLDFGGQSGVLALDGRTGDASDWQVGLDIDRPVFDLDLSPSGDVLYMATGGAGGRLYAFEPDGSTDELWRVKVDGDCVGVAASETTVYLMGHYDFIVDPESGCYRRCPEGLSRRHLAAFDALTGEVDPWDPRANTSTGPYVAAVGEGHLYVGGEFTEINGRPQPGFAQFPGKP
ncbi:MAG: hypothetical protein ACRDV9_00195 [Acidimicrobiia bacterium]